jgi:hypothetical protein
MQALLDLWHGISRHPWKTAGLIYLAFSALFTSVQAINFFDERLKFEGLIYLALLIALSVVFAFWRVWKPSKICIPIDHTNTSIEIVYGDIFRMSGIKIISVNNFFDSEIGRPVSDKSLHGTFIKRAFGGHPEGLDAQLEIQLANAPFTDAANKQDGKSRGYEIGTTALIDVAGDSYILVALAESNPVTCKASSDVTKMWLALHGAWQRARIEAGGHDINVALVGSGLAGLGLPTRDLLNLIILSAITETKAQEITRKIRIVLHRDRFEDLDLRDVKQHWEQ